MTGEQKELYLQDDKAKEPLEKTSSLPGTDVLQDAKSASAQTQGLSREQETFESEKPVYDYEAERAKKLAYRASLTEEDIARMRKHGKPANYHFGQKVVEGVENTQASGDDDERKRSAEEIERDARIEAAARVDDWQTKLDQMSFDERVQATIDCLERRQSFSRVLRSIMEYCLEEHTSEDVEAYIETLPDFAANRQSARRYVFFLMRTGALEEVGFDAEGNVVDARTVSSVQNELTPKQEDAEDVSTESLDAQAQEETELREEEKAVVSEEIEEAAADTEALQESKDDASDSEGFWAEAAQSGDTQPVDPEDLIVEWRISTTDVGRTVLERTDERSRLTKLLDEQTSQDRYAAYLDLLTFCEEQRSLKEISEFLIGNPGLEIDDRGIIHMQPNAYIGKLDKAGALVWTDGGWKTTGKAVEVLKTL